ncbi:hypothetical protein NQ317_006586 [Molorchus minor]|uniref:Uncharacterized protein n=1 Tax=Molorchus minor TaxID=1323400 RepID=A0ABQ9JYZ5_9CUCU|nr:hypothetical protein NQ317_006586 [Molorchus minor]
MNASTGNLLNCAWWQRQGLEIGGPKKILETGMEIGHRPNTEYPWYAYFDIKNKQNGITIIKRCALNVF